MNHDIARIVIRIFTSDYKRMQLHDRSLFYFISFVVWVEQRLVGLLYVSNKPNELGCKSVKAQLM
jgi:hypothetical protein